ncbi:MAG: DNA-binding protein WhiA [Syntrophomonadaceae bacterium]|jgi:DNA-binding protein WhiA|nr:DNA-binding protein WhiA [Syntrophomonadaceae bacterium]
MSFSNDVRNELAREMGEKECCQKAELSALFASSGKLSGESSKYLLSLTLDNAATARKAFKMIKNVYGLQSKVNVANRRFFRKNRFYVVNTELGRDLSKLRSEIILYQSPDISRRINWSQLGKACCKRAYLRGLFLSRGFINRPEGSYHLEIICNTSKMAADIKKLMGLFDLPAGIVERKNSLVIYLKEGEKIVDFLRLVGANKALLDFENVRILKSVRNNVNRQVNCETANLAKTIDASLRQVELIQHYVEKNGWESIPINLRELALLRVEHPDYSLKELGSMLGPSLSKSGTAYRMRKLETLIEADAGNEQ